MPMVVLVHAHYDKPHLEKVRAEMAAMGSPTIRVIDGVDHYIALEGCHRLRAAAADDVPVCFDVIDVSGNVDLDTLDLDIDGEFGDERLVPVIEFLDWLDGRRGAQIDYVSVEAA